MVEKCSASMFFQVFFFLEQFCLWKIFNHSRERYFLRQVLHICRALVSYSLHKRYMFAVSIRRGFWCARFDSCGNNGPGSSAHDGSHDIQIRLYPAVLLLFKCALCVTSSGSAIVINGGENNMQAAERLGLFAIQSQVRNSTQSSGLLMSLIRLIGIH